MGVHLKRTPAPTSIWQTRPTDPRAENYLGRGAPTDRPAHHSQGSALENYWQIYLIYLDLLGHYCNSTSKRFTGNLRQ